MSDKHSITEFGKPVKVIQVFRNINTYRKNEHSFADRKEVLAWNAFDSRSGFVEDGKLYLPGQILKDPHFLQAALITLEDDQQPHIYGLCSIAHTDGYGRNVNATTNRCYLRSKAWSLDIFKIIHSSPMDIHLNYGHFEVGQPERQNFKLCELEELKAVEIRINGKLDHSMSSGRERLYKEQQYIFKYLGEFDQCHILQPPIIPVQKKIPPSRKDVNLLKPLW
ncbi:MAG: hypothetical protein GY751_14140 [Bacteroidetes bacterium]|nr:hypothetical protein [Bacteroidota bacterium]